MIATLLAGLVVSTPTFVVEGLGAGEVLEAEAKRHYKALERVWEKETGALEPMDVTIRIEAGKRFGPRENGRSTFGRITLRETERKGATERQRLALRHELAHQLLFVRCPAASRDALFQEAFAVLTSGELDRWLTEHLTSVEAVRRLNASRRYDRPSARAAIARLVAEARGREAVMNRLARCKGGWTDLTVAELVSGEHELLEDATIVLSRHSGEVLSSAGSPALAMPYGSTLKPFVVAGHGPGPELAVRDGDPMWACEAQGTMATTDALLRSCNGYFLDWAPKGSPFGRYEALLAALDVRPKTMAEAIGLVGSHRLSAFALAQAYRVLAEADPSTIDSLRANTSKGTLAGLGLEVDGATKTGTVRAPDGTPRLGWIAFVDDDLVVVLARRGRAPSTFAAELERVVGGARSADLRAATVAGAHPSGCAQGGLPVSIDATIVIEHRPSTRRLCLGAGTKAGAGVLEADGRLRTTARRALAADDRVGHTRSP